MGRVLIALACLCMLWACSTPPPMDQAPAVSQAVQAVSLLGQPLVPAEPDAGTLEKLSAARAAYEADPDDVEKLIWYGRRTAYTGDYFGAIRIYTDGIERFPDDARLWRHRGHRHISIREFDLAVSDLEQAALLIGGTDDQVEPDGIPNALNRPVSTLHSNIRYHLGLVHYLRNDLHRALEVYSLDAILCTNDDQLVSVTHWLYLTLRRLGREDAARTVLDPIHPEMEIIENMAYHRLCLFYKGELGEQDLLDPDTGAVMSDATAYGLANWHLCSGDREEARRHLDRLVAGETWASFGHIAAEADLAREFTSTK
jgi:tetratricopeptide (TPR) repeat protein